MYFRPKKNPQWSGFEINSPIVKTVCLNENLLFLEKGIFVTTGFALSRINAIRQLKSLRFAVNGDDAAPLWKFLKKSQPGALSFIKWNFTKFLIDRNGVPIQRFGPKDNPVAIERHIVAALST